MIDLQDTTMAKREFDFDAAAGLEEASIKQSNGIERTLKPGHKY